MLYARSIVDVPEEIRRAKDNSSCPRLRVRYARYRSLKEFVSAVCLATFQGGDAIDKAIYSCLQTKEWKEAAQAFLEEQHPALMIECRGGQAEGEGKDGKENEQQRRRRSRRPPLRRRTRQCLSMMSALLLALRRLLLRKGQQRRRLPKA